MYNHNIMRFFFFGDHEKDYLVIKAYIGLEKKVHMQTWLSKQ